MTREADLSPIAKTFLQDLQCSKLYGEVLDIDLVGKTDKNILIGLELKTRLNIKVLEQAHDRLEYVNYVWIAIPLDKLPKDYFVLSKVYKHFIESYGIGLVGLKTEITQQKYVYYQIYKHAKLKRTPKYIRAILNNLDEFTLNKDGGFRSGDTITPYMLVVDEIKRALKDQKDWVHIDKVKERLHLAKRHYSNLHSGVYTVLNRYAWAEKYPTKKSYYRYREEFEECH